MATPPGNPDQIAYWNDRAGATWSELQDQLDRQLAPLGDQAIKVLAPQPGERILDIGCGCGATTLALAEAVGPAGLALGVDISRPMLDVAAARAVGAARFEEADAQTASFEAQSFDAVFSRFGVMFFSDPVAAFANLWRTLRVGGRMTFVCWRTLAEVEFMRLPLAAALTVIPPPPPSDPLAPGPLAFADPRRVSDILGRAGFTDIQTAPFDAMVGSGGLEETLAFSQRVGAVAGLLREHPDLAAATTEALREALRPHDGPGGILLPAGVWIVTARRTT